MNFVLIVLNETFHNCKNSFDDIEYDAHNFLIKFRMFRQCNYRIICLASLSTFSKIVY